jgi:hypothetical protein
MTDVKFLEVNPSDSSDYIFSDKSGGKYHIFNDARGKDVQNMTPDFWGKFYFYEKIKVDYLANDGTKIIKKIISYK